MQGGVAHCPSPIATIERLVGRANNRASCASMHARQWLATDAHSGVSRRRSRRDHEQLSCPDVCTYPGRAAQLLRRGACTLREQLSCPDGVRIPLASSSAARMRVGIPSASSSAALRAAGVGRSGAAELLRRGIGRGPWAAELVCEGVGTISGAAQLLWQGVDALPEQLSCLGGRR